MLEESDDFPQNLLYLYRRTTYSYETFVAWSEGEVDGVLSGSFKSDFIGDGTFGAFELPPAPHALLERVHVRGSARRQGVGQALIQTFALEASERGCSFIGGLIDQSSDPWARTALFEGLGFSISEVGDVGAQPTAVLAAIANR